MSPENKVRFSLTQLEHRDVPSMVSVTIDKPDEYATETIAYQQAWDGVVSDVTSNLTFDDTTTLLGTVPIAAQPEATEPVLANNAQRQLTPEETAEIKKLADLIAKIKTAITGPGGLQDSRKTWEGILATQNTALDGLKAQLPKAQNDLEKAQKALVDYDQFVGGRGPERNALVDALGQAKGRLKGVQDSIAVVENLLKNIQQRIDFINSWITRYQNQIDAANQRIGEITSAAIAGQPSTPAPAIDFVPYPQLTPDAGDWRKPLVVPADTTTPTTPTPTPTTPTPTTPTPTTPTPEQYQSDPFAPVVV